MKKKGLPDWVASLIFLFLMWVFGTFSKYPEIAIPLLFLWVAHVEFPKIRQHQLLERLDDLLDKKLKG